MKRLKKPVYVTVPIMSDTLIKDENTTKMKTEGASNMNDKVEQAKALLEVKLEALKEVDKKVLIGAGAGVLAVITGVIIAVVLRKSK